MDKIHHTSTATFAQTTPIETLELSNGGNFDVLRMDLIHPIASGNKLFKLKPFIDLFLQIQNQNENRSLILQSCGGLWSNHLHALAFLGNAMGLPTAAWVRGLTEEIFLKIEQDECSGKCSDYPILQDCLRWNMKLLPISRMDYSANNNRQAGLSADLPNTVWIPEGGRSIAAAESFSEYCSSVPSFNSYSTIICCVGSGTMMAGIIKASAPHQRVIGFCPFKKVSALEDNITKMLGDKNEFGQSIKNQSSYLRTWEIRSTSWALADFKHQDVLLNFMNDFYRRTKIPTDIIYTAKMFYQLERMIQEEADKKLWNNNQKILVIHCGGLQGNRSLPPRSLIF